jgi:FKBP-type peptidyl-prolyl cis-trans isomerase FkpA
MRKFLFLLFLPILFGGCKKTDQAALDQQTIQQYIKSHQLTAIAEPNGLYYVPNTIGTGGYPSINDTVTVNYVGYYTDGSVFDQTTSASGPYTTPLSNVIAGWQEGIPLMQKGGSALLLIPSALAYGTQGKGPIPGNTVLIFNVTLVSFQ